MKEFLIGLIALILSTAVTCVVIPTSFVYNFFYALWLSITLKDWKAFPRFIWKTIDGTFAAIGYIFYHISMGQDIMWNVNGEMLEDMITDMEDTKFGDKTYTVSASVGHIQKNNKLNKYGKWCSKVLNFMFWQKSHALDSWEFQTKKRELKSNYFGKLK